MWIQASQNRQGLCPAAEENSHQKKGVNYVAKEGSGN